MLGALLDANSVVEGTEPRLGEIDERIISHVFDLSITSSLVGKTTGTGVGLVRMGQLGRISVLVSHEGDISHKRENGDEDKTAPFVCAISVIVRLGAVFTGSAQIIILGVITTETREL
jgi:hypothetical protein